MGRIRSDSLRRVSAEIEPLAWEGARALIATHLDRYEHWNEAKQVAYVSVLHVGKYLSHLARKRDAVNFRLFAWRERRLAETGARKTRLGTCRIN
jgi:hypothetical protein